jgi:PKD repeat protein
LNSFILYSRVNNKNNKDYMKKITLFTLLLALSLTGFSQDIILQEDFSTASGTTPPTGWTDTMYAGDRTVDRWDYENTKLNFPMPMEKNWAIFDAYNGGSAGGTATNGRGESVALITPEFSSMGRNNLYLELDRSAFVSAFGSSASIDITTDSGATWNQLWQEIPFHIDGNPVSMVLDLSAYTNEPDLYIRFYWNYPNFGTYAGYFAIDNVRIYERKANDIKVAEMIQMFDNSCPTTKQGLEVIFENSGTALQSVVPVQITVGGVTYRDTIRSMGSGQRISAFLDDSINTSLGGTFDFEIVASLASDQLRFNDTMRVSRVSSPPAALPVPVAGERCGVGSVQLSASRNPGDSTYWFLNETGGQDVGSGSPFMTPVINQTTTFWVENSRVVYNDITTGAGLYRFNATTTGPGAMFDVTAKNEIIIDSFSQHFAYGDPTSLQPYAMTLKYKVGSYRGSETVAADWTTVDLVRDTVFSAGYGYFYTIVPKTPIRIPAGSTYGFYIDADLSSITFTLGAVDLENADLRITGNTVLQNDHANALNNYYWNGEIFFKKTCSTPRDSVVATVHPRPIGARAIAGSTFEGFYKSGTANDPDITSEESTLIYEVTPPTGFTNADLGTTWMYTDIEVLTSTGSTIPAGDTATTVSTSGNATFTYTPSMGYADSTLIVRVTFTEFTNMCDSTVERVIFIAPTPKVDFEAKNVCLGDPIEFTNLSTISSGFMSHEWDFGDGNTSDFESPIHLFTAAGTYKVKLTSTSDLGISNDTTIDIEVFEVPDVKIDFDNVCFGNNTVFTNNTTVLGGGTITYEWDMGDGTTYTTKDVTHTYPSAGNYTLTVVANANGCPSTLIRNVNVFAVPSASFTVDEGCVGEDITVNNTSTIGLNEPLGSLWDMGENNEIKTTENPSYAYQTSGSKSIKLIAVSQFGCEDSVTQTVNIKPAPLADFTYDKSCNIDPVNFTNETNENGLSVIYDWDFGDGNSSTNPNPSNKYSIGRYMVTLMASATNGCTNSYSEELNVQVQPDVAFSVDNACSGEAIQFRNETKSAGGSVTYKWLFGDGDSSDFTSPYHTYNVSSGSEVFVATLAATVNGGCTDIATANVEVFEQPECDFTYEHVPGTNRRTFKFTPADATYGDNAYSWVFKGSGRDFTVSPTHEFAYDDKEFMVIFSITTDDGCNCIDSSQFVFAGWSVGVNDVLAEGVQVYPNPNAGSFTISLPSSSDDYSVELFDATGKSLRTVDVPKLSDQVIVNMEDAAEGVYFVRLSQGNSYVMKRVIIQR